jgi:hypothetical protein
VGLFRRPFFCQGEREPLALGGRQPSRTLGPIGQNDQRQDTQHHGRHAFEKKQPLPAAQAQPPVEIQDGFRQRRADNYGHWSRHHEEGSGPGTIGGRYPVGQI